MESGGDNTDVEEELGPQLTSDDPNERKLARKLRIERRQAAAEKRSSVELQTDQSNVDPIKMQIDESFEKLTKLLIEGDEYVTNIKIANENREINRRENGLLNHNNILQQIEDETNVTNESFNQLIDKWDEILNYKDPLDMSDGIINQREHFNEILQQKDAIIKMLKEQINKSEIDFSNDQLKQENDINALIKRIERQIFLMRKAFKTELNEIEQTILDQQQAYIEASNKEWENLLKKRDANELKNLETKFAELENFYEKMKALKIDFEEQYRDAKIKMEQQCDQLKREFEKIKTMLNMNREKLDYNYQILKMKENENILIKSQQKRRLNKLQDTLINLKAKMNDYQNDNRTKINKLNKHIEYLQQNIIGIENKTRNFTKSNDEQFKNLWQMNQEKVETLYGEILKIDQVLYEQQLRIEWKPPEDLANPNDVNNCKSLLPLLAEIVNPVRHLSKKSVNLTNFLGKETKIYRRLLKHILEEIAKKGDFLIDDQIKAILKPYNRDETTLVTISNVFDALKIHDRDDIDLMLVYFLPYMRCPECTPQIIASAETVDDHDQAQVTVSQTEVSGQFDLDLKKDEEIEAKQAASEILAAEDKFTCRYHHQLVISPVYVLRALKDFLGVCHQEKLSTTNADKSLSQEKQSISRQITESDLNFYWNRYKECFSEEKLQLWDSLCDGLKKYHQVLKERKSLCEEVAILRQENRRLKALFN